MINVLVGRIKFGGWNPTCHCKYIKFGGLVWDCHNIMYRYCLSVMYMEGQWK